MNISYSSLNNTDQIDLIELYYLQLGSTWSFDSMFLFLNLPIAIGSLFLNMISYLIFDRFTKTNFNNKRTYHEYLKIYTLFSMLISFHNSINSFASAPRYFDMNTYWFSFYKCKLAIWIFTLLYYYLNVLDCILLMERLSSLTDGNQHNRISIYLRSFFKLNPKLISLLILIICVLVNLISFFFVSPRNDADYKEVMNDYNKIVKFTYCNREGFFSNSPGTIIVVLIIFIRDVLPLIFEIILGLYSIFMFRKFLKDLSRELPSMNESQFDSKTVTTSRNNPTLNKIENYNEKLTRMTIYLCICSILSHIGVALGLAQLTNIKLEQIFCRE